MRTKKCVKGWGMGVFSPWAPFRTCWVSSFLPKLDVISLDHNVEVSPTISSMRLISSSSLIRYFCFTHSPFSPVFVGGELFTGLTADFLGRDSVIFRSMGGRSTMRTETDHKILHGNILSVGLSLQQRGNSGFQQGWNSHHLQNKWINISE